MRLSRVLLVLAAALAFAACSLPEPTAPRTPAGPPRYEGSDSTAVPTVDGRNPFMGGSAG